MGHGFHRYVPNCQGVLVSIGYLQHFTTLHDAWQWFGSGSTLEYTYQEWIAHWGTSPKSPFCSLVIFTNQPQLAADDWAMIFS